MKNHPMAHKRVTVGTACLVLFCTLAGISVLSQTAAQDKQPQPAKPEITSLGNGEYTEWSEGPDSSSTRTSLTAPDGSNMMIFDYIFYKGDKGVKELLKNCTKDALTVLEGSKVPSENVKKARVRTLATFRDREGHDSAVLCRSDGTHTLTMIHGSTVENVLGLERSEFPKK